MVIEAAGESVGDRDMGAVPLKILVVDDEQPIRKLLRMGFLAQGYEFLEAANGKIAVQLLSQKLDLVILDLGLPDIEGLDLLQKIRGSHEGLPIVVLSSRSDELTKVRALEFGADDYITKPFGMEELFARVRAALRHRLQSPKRQIFRTGDLTVDLVAHIVKIGNREIKLTPKEHELLRLLVQHAGKVLTHRFLLGELREETADPQYLRVYVQHLRQKIETDPGQPQYLLTETGIGYRLRAAQVEPV
jgi:two-component system, OmpR family, KDP operon response regulator KdpE